MEFIWRKRPNFIDVTLKYNFFDLLQVVSGLLWCEFQLAPVVVEFEYDQQLLQIESCEGALNIFEHLQVLFDQYLWKNSCGLLVIHSGK